MLKVAICDGSCRDRKTLLDFCRHFFEKKEKYEIEIFDSGKDYINRSCQPDILLLDIEMDGTDGMTVKEWLRKEYIHPRILFVSTCPAAMEEAFDRNVYGFLVKPLSYETFEKRMEVICEDIKRESTDIKRNSKYIRLEGVLKSTLVCVEEILYISAQDKSVNIYLRDGKVFFDKRNIGRWGEMLFVHFSIPAHYGTKIIQ